jgi:hypothetical protein
LLNVTVLVPGVNVPLFVQLPETLISAGALRVLALMVRSPLIVSGLDAAVLVPVPEIVRLPYVAVWIVWLEPAYSTVLVELKVVGVAEGQTFPPVDVVRKVPVPLMVKLAKAVSWVVVLLRKLFTDKIPPLLIVSVPVFAEPASASKFPPVTLKVPLEIVIDLDLMLVDEFVPVTPASNATSKTNPVVVPPQFVPNNARLVEPTNLIVVLFEMIFAFGLVVLESKVP